MSFKGEHRDKAVGIRSTPTDPRYTRVQTVIVDIRQILARRASASNLQDVLDSVQEIWQRGHPAMLEAARKKTPYRGPRPSRPCAAKRANTAFTYLRSYADSRMACRRTSWRLPRGFEKMKPSSGNA